MPDLLIELFSEEIPARMQAKAADDLKSRVTNGLVEAGLTYAGAAAYATPRRLALRVDGLTERSPDVKEERKGPRTDAAEKAIEGFLRGAGVSREDLIERDEKKGRVFYAVIEKPGRPAAEIVADVLEDTIRNFPWPKSMRWGAGSLRWVRPLHRIVCVLSREDGSEIVPLDVDGIVSGRTTEGHRFMAPGTIDVSGFDDYEAKLKRAHVVLDAGERAEAIWQDATNQAFASGLEVVEDNGLLAEVAGLVEWPVVLMGEIGEDFLGLPPEVLQTSMKEHQKFFSVRNPKTGRIERFITVANRETADHGATILAGNQKVLSARLSDAKFFWENDLRVAKTDGLTAWTDSLSNVTFHNKLGSQKARIERIAALARELAPVVGADAELAEQAARVAKADLASEMVYEFPELQGLMGRYYSDAAGLPPEVGAACQEHYSPLGPSDDVPSAPVSVAVALADKIDTLTGFWAIDEKPTGSKDPFALRRAALGVIRLMLENELTLELNKTIINGAARNHFDMYYGSKEKALEKLESLGGAEIHENIIEDAADSFAKSVRAFDPDDPEEYAIHQFPELFTIVAPNLLSFFHDRLKVYLRDQGVRHDVIDACIAMPGNDDLALLVTRAKALQAVLETEDGENLVQGFKRANNILTQAEEKDGVEYSFGGDPKFAEDATETALFEALATAEGKITPAIQAQDFSTAMAAMADLRGPVDAFFEAVQVNAENPVLRRNRLNLLSSIRSTCLRVADLTKIEG
ncbi:MULTISPECIES: glycine--tRNA ligase subunit beta [Marivita]|uniref:Glycine--tRNA ligase beta subunit n=1 Tax=Marivita cryptomonadis TaxID=505252 RepID=A0A9Q2NV10_9RHOB|nr:MULTISPECIES: glycine--tRNA ligase subunit beta [Marivita]MCR9167771.1 glycine--tRNA ligase subunit beta [Paracoccaceae bacterium]MBM2320307.1 glycine--tRNA ligase subunit beta [Marivita cryptomonadis]MBM2329887.1 glycine--tRNA ligase subunit beta [Marivita cryptomonadis]MBM2339474.1 glycine--tRNA ligase subunit beta [Marivita cryptomonadis]MBM2344133.1 glycine--tRNA ligase subunit beta [Marivita cryptomonadis]